MQIQRVLSTCAVAVALLATAAHAESQDDPCSFPMSKMYVRDAKQVQFPTGFLSCLGANTKTIARCAECNCREIQSATTNGKTISWGLCIEDATSCVSPQAPDRKQCAAETEASNTTDSTDFFQPGVVQPADALESGTPITKVPADTVTDQEALAANTSGVNNGRGNTGTMVIAGCAVAGVAGVAMFAVARKKKGKALGTPRQGAYKDNDTSKARTNNVRDPHQQVRMVVDPSLGSDFNQYGSDPIAVSHQQQQVQKEEPLPAFDNRRRDTHASSSDEGDEAFETFGGDTSGGFSAFDLGETQRDGDSFGSELETNMSMGYSAHQANDEDEYYGDGDSRVSYNTRDTADSTYLRDSDDSVMMSSASSLSFYNDEGSPRKSIEF
ncbi:hypothetical protein Poli38472_007888 [Pythium oligandrum]|uniref:Uncharacterized protein n=1 Tax=Pythium oligandrum TaxID=41045 RepID=A0A8K1CT94_PYTOL|nr:hypothetical protein Poli38472_007888 [Pythium oligandrum]|eukprot:TMW68216.1 hypothetical protein Poli38472_007888 [Pythium oligandrum]